MEETEEIAQASNAAYTWIETPNGRHRIWCKVCRSAGRAWMTPEPCEHVMNGKPEHQITNTEALNTLRELLSEPSPSLPANADPN